MQHYLLISSMLLIVMLLMQPVLLFAADDNESKQTGQIQKKEYTCSELGALIIDQQKQCAQSLHSLKRDMAALQQKMDQPGIQDITAGIGYILGIFGTAAFVASQRKQTKTNQ